MKPEDLIIYNMSMDLSDEIWFMVEKWNFFQQDTVGRQWVRAADSVSANISEGVGRGTYPDQRKFYFYSRGSNNESRTWLEKAKRRGMIDPGKYEELKKEHDILEIKLNNFIKSVNSKIKK